MTNSNSWPSHFQSLVKVAPVNNTEDWEADLVEVYIKDYYISRIDMWLLNRELIGRCVSEQQKIVMYSLGTNNNNCTIQLNNIYQKSGHRLKVSFGIILYVENSKFSTN